MGWENRGNIKYYYRKMRIGSRVVSRYVGTDEVGQLAELQDELRRLGIQQAQLSSEVAAEEISQVRQIDGHLREAEDLVRAVMQAAMLVNGYHTHRREWRRRKTWTNR